MHHVRLLAGKEFRHIVRDPKSLLIIGITPLLLLLIFGYSISLEVKRIDLAIVDFSREPLSREFIQSLARNDRFHLVAGGNFFSIEKAEEMLRSGQIDAYLVLPAGLQSGFSRGQPGAVGTVVDGSDMNSAFLVNFHLRRALLDFVNARFPRSVGAKLERFFHFNPGAQANFFFIPGLVAVLTLMIAAFLTSISIAREREQGSYDLLKVMPIRPWALIVGKTIPKFVLAMVIGLSILLFSTLWFHLPWRGSALALVLFFFPYVMCGLAIGMLVSSAVSSQKSALITTAILTLLPAIFFSGFALPLEQFDPLMRFFANLVPTTHFLKAEVGIMIRGADPSVYVREGIILSIYGIGLMLLAMIQVRWGRGETK
jgi:ABC-2 type transport system permease protein